MYSKPVLLDMPEVPMWKIMEYLNLTEVLRFRKVCHDIRNFIDEKKVEGYIKGLVVALMSDKIILYVNYTHVDRVPNPLHKLLEYETSENGSVVVCGNTRKTLESVDFIQAFLNDFKILLNLQKSTLGFLNVVYEYWRIPETEIPTFISVAFEFSNRFETFLKTRSSLLKVEKITIVTIEQKEVMKILPYINPDTLDLIFVRAFGRGVEDIAVELEEMVELPQWKKAKRLWMSPGVVVKPVHNFSHFSYADVRTDTLTPEDLMVVKNNLLASPNLANFQRFSITSEEEFGDLDFDKHLFEIFGEPCYEQLVGKEWKNNRATLPPCFHSEPDPMWFFRIPNFHLILWVSRFCSFNFSLIKESCVPTSAIIQD